MDRQLDQLLEKQYSDRHRKQERSYNDPAFWLSIMNSIEPETGPEVFQQLTAPFTLKKAHQLYRYLRSGKARTLPKKSYSVIWPSARVSHCAYSPPSTRSTGSGRSGQRRVASCTATARPRCCSRTRT